MSKPMGRRGDKQREKPEFDQYVLDLSRVTRVTKGGKHMSFRAGVILGDRHGRVGFGLAKGKDVQERNNFFQRKYKERLRKKFSICS